MPHVLWGYVWGLMAVGTFKVVISRKEIELEYRVGLLRLYGGVLLVAEGLFSGVADEHCISRTLYCLYVCRHHASRTNATCMHEPASLLALLLLLAAAAKRSWTRAHQLSRYCAIYRVMRRPIGRRQ
jgi:hypothetical protein